MNSSPLDPGLDSTQHLVWEKKKPTDLFLVYWKLYEFLNTAYKNTAERKQVQLKKTKF